MNNNSTTMTKLMRRRADLPYFPEDKRVAMFDLFEREAELTRESREMWWAHYSEPDVCKRYDYQEEAERIDGDRVALAAEIEYLYYMNYQKELAI